MKKYEVSTIGQFHLNHNEDALITSEIGEDKLLIAVMDGCSMGTESHFASTLIGKTLRKIAKEISFKTFVEKTEKSLDGYLEEILRQLFSTLQDIKNLLMLEQEELLSTLILGILNHKNRTAVFITIGDGLICCNSKYTEYEQDNKPDYLAYHLYENFDTWFTSQKQKLYLQNIYDLSISTDGIFTFKKFDGKQYISVKNSHIIELLLIDKQWENQKNMLSRKLLEIERKFGLKPSDDLSIIRIIIT
ncbi:MAG: protein phosphatase 2C domain-containing protein [Chitinophagales bacterium]